LCDKPSSASRACTKMHPMANGQSSRSILLDLGKGMDGPGEKVLNSRSFSMILSALRRGEPLLNSPAALMTSRFRQRCFRAAGCSPHPPSCACSDHEKLAAHSKPFSPGPSIPHPKPRQPFIPLISQCAILPPKKNQARWPDFQRLFMGVAFFKCVAPLNIAILKNL